MASFSCSVVLLEQQGLTFMAEQVQALKAEALVGRDICLVSNGVWQASLLLLFVMDYKLVGSMVGPTLPLST